MNQNLFLKLLNIPIGFDAMNDEMEALNKNDTYEITELPPGRKAIGNKWVWKIKFKSNGEVDRYKARLVVKGCNQKEEWTLMKPSLLL